MPSPLLPPIPPQKSRKMSIFELELNLHKLAIFPVNFEQAIFRKKKIIGTPFFGRRPKNGKTPSGPLGRTPPEGPEGPDPPGPPRTPPDPPGPPRTSPDLPGPPALRSSGPPDRRSVGASQPPVGAGAGRPLIPGPRPGIKSTPKIRKRFFFFSLIGESFLC